MNKTISGMYVTSVYILNKFATKDETEKKPLNRLIGKIKPRITFGSIGL